MTQQPFVDFTAVMTERHKEYLDRMITKIVVLGILYDLAKWKINLMQCQCNKESRYQASLFESYSRVQPLSDSLSNRTSRTCVEWFVLVDE